jgi:hypothetical protein
LVKIAVEEEDESLSYVILWEDEFDCYCLEGTLLQWQYELPEQANWIHTLKIQVNKAKDSRNKTGVAQRVPGVLGSQISWHSAREGGEVVSLRHRPPLPPGMFLVLIFTRDWVDPKAMVRSEGNMSLKNLVTPPEFDPGTVRLVAQRLNHCATPGRRRK